MSSRDRAGQTAIATGQYAFNLTGGTALTDLLLFEHAFQVPTTAMIGGTVYWYDVPVLVKPTSGAAAGSFALMYCTLARNGAGGLTLTSSADDCVQTSTFDNTAKTFTALPIASSDAVEVLCVPVGMGLIDVRGRTRLTAPADGVDGTSAARLLRSETALLAIGQGAMAGSPSLPAAHAVAIGDLAEVTNKGGYALGYAGYVGSPYAGVVGGYRSQSGYAYGVGHGMNGVLLLQAGTTPAEAWTNSVHAFLATATTDATPATLKAYDPLLAAAPDTPAIAGHDALYCDAGLTVFEGVLTAIDADSGDMKRWFLKWSVRTTMNYATTSLFGTLDKGTPQEDAGAAAWDVAITTDSGTNTCSVEVTGAAATEIVWQFSFRLHQLTVYA